MNNIICLYKILIKLEELNLNVFCHQKKCFHFSYTMHLRVLYMNRNFRKSPKMCIKIQTKPSNCFPNKNTSLIIEVTFLKLTFAYYISCYFVNRFVNILKTQLQCISFWIIKKSKTRNKKTPPIYILNKFTAQNITDNLKML